MFYPRRNNRSKEMLALCFALMCLAVAVIFWPSQSQPAPHITLTVSAEVSASTYVDPEPGWSGYLLWGRAVNGTYASGTWRTPMINCSASETDEVLIWVGLGGTTNNTLEQIGTRQGCNHGKAYWSGWYEFWPEQNDTQGVALGYSPGDSIFASVRLLNSSGREAYFSFGLRDLNATSSYFMDTTTYNHFTARADNYNTDASAEWIVEAPGYDNGSRSALSDYGTVRFSNASAVLNGETDSIRSFGISTTPALYPTWYVCDVPLATVSQVDEESSGFSVTWEGGPFCPPPSSTSTSTGG